MRSTFHFYLIPFQSSIWTFYSTAFYIWSKNKRIFNGDLNAFISTMMSFVSSYFSPSVDFGSGFICVCTKFNPALLKWCQFSKPYAGQMEHHLPSKFETGKSVFPSWAVPLAMWEDLTTMTQISTISETNLVNTSLVNILTNL